MLRITRAFTWQRLYALAVISFFALHLIGEFVPARFDALFDTYGIILIAFLVGAYLSKYGLSGPAEIVILFVWFAWALLTRALNGDIYLIYEFQMMIMILMLIVFFSAGTVLGKEDRMLFLDVVSLLYIGMFLLVAILGIFVFITNTYIHIPPEEAWFTIRLYGGVFSPNYLSTSRLLAAPRFLIAMALLAYQFVRHKNKLFRCAAILGILIFYVAIALCHSRTAQIAMCILAAMAGILAARCFFKNHSGLRQLLASCVLAALALVLCYKGCSWSTVIVDRMHSAAAPAVEAYYNELETKPNPEYFGIGRSAEEMIAEENLRELLEAGGEAALQQQETLPEVPTADKEETITAVDDRTIKGNWSFTERVEIWLTGLVNIYREPSIGLKGMLSTDVTDNINGSIHQLFPYIIEDKANMHNSYLEVLMVTGVPGFALIALWVILLVKKMLMVFFSRDEKVSLATKFLTLPVAGFMVVCLAESIMFTWMEISGVTFSIIAGAFLGCYYDCFPVSQKEKRSFFQRKRRQPDVS